jgi:hypothetical protein
MPTIISACDKTKIFFLPLESAKGVRRSRPMIEPMYGADWMMLLSSCPSQYSLASKVAV